MPDVSSASVRFRSRWKSSYFRLKSSDRALEVLLEVAPLVLLQDERLLVVVLLQAVEVLALALQLVLRLLELRLHLVLGLLAGVALVQRALHVDDGDLAAPPRAPARATSSAAERRPPPPRPPILLS